MMGSWNPGFRFGKGYVTKNELSSENDLLNHI